MRTTDAVLMLKDVSRIYSDGNRTVCALSAVSLTVERGSSVAIVGSSGSGKSTLLNLLGCLDRPTAGEVVVNGRSIKTLTDEELSALRRSLFGFVFQSYNLISRWTAEQNVELPLQLGGMPGPQRKERVRQALAQVRMQSRRKHTPAQLSGGQEQRIALARAIVNNPAIILADEPTGSLDPDTAKSILTLLTDLNKAGQTLFIVTHDKNVAEHCARTIEIQNGRIINDYQNHRAVKYAEGS